MILVPVKNVEQAKQRLSDVFDATERCRLAEVMLEDVLQTLGNWTNRPPVAVVTSDSHARRLARWFCFEIIDDPINSGETNAIAMATCVCKARGIRSALVIPGDIPLAEVGELEQVLAAHLQGAYVSGGDSRAVLFEGTVLVPAADGQGTNAALRCPPALFPLRFGTDSFSRHLRAAQATGRPCTVLRLPGIALDVDTPADLAALLAAETCTRSQELLRTWGVPERLERLARIAGAAGP